MCWSGRIAGQVLRGVQPDRCTNRGTLLALRPWDARRFETLQNPGLKETMKPAIETPSGVSPDPFHKSVRCLRCEQPLERYQLMRTSLAPGNSGHAILSCPRCGHVEFVSEASPLLQNLELVAVDTGDGD